jgi:hypothetical protein
MAQPEVRLSSTTMQPCDFPNAPGAIRTHDPRIRNPVLYPPELRGRSSEVRHLADGARRTKRLPGQIVAAVRLGRSLSLST